MPTAFRGMVRDQKGPDVFVTSVTGESVLIYSMAVWLEIERKLAAMPASHPSRRKYLDRVSYYGQSSELDGQGRIVIPPLLRTSASIVGDVRVFGKLDYLDVWNEERFVQKMQREPWLDEDGLRLADFGV